MAISASMVVLGWSAIDLTPVPAFSSFAPAPLPAIGESVGRVLAYVPDNSSSSTSYSSALLGQITDYLDHGHRSSGSLPPIPILSSGCSVPKTDPNEHFAGTKNCGYACNGGILLSDSHTIWNCAVLSAVNILSKAEVIKLDAESRRRVNNSPLGLHYGPHALWDEYHPAIKMAGQDGVMEEDLEDVEGGWKFYGLHPRVMFSTLAGSMRGSCERPLRNQHSTNVNKMSCSSEILDDAKALEAWFDTELDEQKPPTPEAAIAIVRNLHHLLLSYCEGAPKPEGLSDISGPGVLISVAIQTTIWLALFLALRIFTSWAAILSYPGFALAAYRTRTRHEKPASQSPWSRSKDLQARLAKTRLARALVPAALDLHETQLFLTMALQTAVILTNTTPTPTILYHNGVTPDITRPVPFTPFYATHLIDSLATTLAGLNSTLPILLASLLLYGGSSTRAPLPSRRQGFHAVAMVITTALMAWGLAPAIIMTMKSPNGPPAVYIRQGDYNQPGPLPLCGLEKLQGGQTGLRGVLFYAIGAGYPVVPALVFQLVVAWLVGRGRSDEEVRRLGVYGVGVAGWLKRRAVEGRGGWWKVAWRVWVGVVEGVWAVMELGVGFFAVVNLVEIVRLLAVIDMGKNAWTLGQLVAMGAVWGPALWRLLNGVFFGVEKSFEPRLPANHEIVTFAVGEDDDLDLFGDETGSPFLDSVMLDDEDVALLGQVMLTDEDIRREEYTDD